MAGFIKKISSFFLRRWPIWILLGTGLLTRLFIFARVMPRLHSDSISYLILQDMDVVRTPGYPLFIAIIQFFNDLFSITNNYLGLIIFVQMILLGLVNCLLIYRLAKNITGSEPFSFGLGLLYNFNYFLIGFEAQILSECLATTLLLLTLTFYSKMYEGKKSTPFIAGLLSALLLLTRPVFLLLFVGLVMITVVVNFRQVFKAGFLKKAARPITIFMAINVLGIASWIVRNKIEFDYTGFAIVMPFQLRHYTSHFFDKYEKGDDEELNRFADIYREENWNSHRFETRLKEDMNMDSIEISKILMKLNMKVILDNPGEYFKQVPGSARDYYRSYSNFWMVPNNSRLLTKKGILPRTFLFIFNSLSKLYSAVPMIVLVVVFMPCVLLLLMRKDKRIFHLVLLIEGTIHYNFLISILSTNSGIDNLRYRVPVEPLILLIFFSALFILLQRGFALWPPALKRFKK